MGLPSPHDIYGILKYENITYNLANRVFDKVLEEKLKEYVEKENISYFPIYPHIPKNPFTTYEIIDNKLYITGISYNDKPYDIREIFGKEKIACNFDATLNAVKEIVDFIVGKFIVSRRDIVKFIFNNGLLEHKEEKIDYWSRRIVALELFIEDAIGFVGIFWIANDHIYSAKQVIRKEDKKVQKMYRCELWDYFEDKFKELRGLKCDEINSGIVEFDRDNNEFIIHLKSDAYKKLVIDEFGLKDKKIKLKIKKS